MNIYLVRNKEHGTYLRIKRSPLITWVEQQQASVYPNSVEAYQDGMRAFNWDDDAKEKFEIVHLVARDETDSRPFTKDGKPVLPGEFYWQTYEHGVERVQVVEISATYYSDHEQIDLHCRLDVNFWVNSGRLYSTEPLAWVAWKEEQV